VPEGEVFYFHSSGTKGKTHTDLRDLCVGPFLTVSSRKPLPAYGAR
jgi:hypothetical protein